jgi:outer membrane lipoprotein-sorting protein
MTRFLSSNRLRWAAPAVVAAAIATAALTSNVTASASGQPKLATKTAATLLAAVEQASPAGLSGTVVETVKLGLPTLPSIDGGTDSADLSPENLLTGSHTLRVWEAGDDQQRLALLGQLSETDIVHNGTDLWTYSSTTRKVTHSTLKDRADDSATTDAGAVTPQVAAQRALDEIDPTTTVQVDNTARVAGVSAYQLSLIPKDSRSLIGSVRIAIAANTSVPLRVQVFARGATSPAIDIGFTDVSFAVPSASIFHFVPPAGTTVVQEKLPFQDRTATADALPGSGSSTDTGSASASDDGTKVLGHGWTAVVETSPSADDPASRGSQRNSTQALLDRIATRVPGGQLVTSSLLSIFLADDGRIFAGPVSATTIEQIASTGQGL